jgi:hypothetical protein
VPVLSGTHPNPELRDILLAQERLEMESLILANEAAVAEVRKHSKDEDKDFKIWPSTAGRGESSNNEAPKPSITSAGIVHELAKQHSGQTAKKTNNDAQASSELPEQTTSNSEYAQRSLPPVHVVFQSLEPKVDNSKDKMEASTQDRAPVINQLLALWSPEASTALSIDLPAESAQRSENLEKMNEMLDAHYRQKKSKAHMVDAKKPIDKPVELPADEPVEETVNLFPSRSRPY